MIDVEDLDVGAAFWSNVTGIQRISSDWPDRFAYLGHEDENDMEARDHPAPCSNR